MPKDDVSSIYDKLLNGQNYQVIQLNNSWLKIFAQNYEGHPALLIRALLPDDKVVVDGRGFSVKTERNGSDAYVRITSEKKGSYEIFNILTGYILERTNKAISEQNAIDLLTDSLSEFKKFFARRSGRLSFEQVQGLFAELTLINLFLSRGASSKSIISAWKGPFGKDGIGLHDFTFGSGRGIEVKSTHQPATEIRVTSPDQLVHSHDQLDLMVLPVETVPIGVSPGVPIRKLISKSIELIGNDQEAQFSFIKALEEIGADFSDEFYDQWCFVPGKWQRYKISDGFPTINLDLVPRGISKISFSLVLQEIRSFTAPVDELLSMGVEK